MLKQNQKGIALIGSLLLLIIIGLIAGTGYYVYRANMNANESFGNAGNSEIAAPKKEDPAEEDPYDGWKEYCSSREKVCFKYPNNWKLKELTSPIPESDSVEISSPNEGKLQFDSVVDGLGGACDNTTEPHIYIHKVTKVPDAENLYIVQTGFKDEVENIGIVDGENGQPPQLGDTGQCLLYTMHKSKQNSEIDVWFRTPNAEALNKTDIPTMELIMKSYSYQ